MDPGNIFQIITNSTLLATRLLPGAGGPVQFSEARYCVLLPEDAPPAVTVAKVTALHKEGIKVRYRITGGNRDGLFTINRRSGLITLAAPLDYELHPKHELVVAAEAEGKMVHTIVQVNVADVNDNAPVFLENDPTVTVIEEDSKGLPATLLKVTAEDRDTVDHDRLVYSIGGDGVDGYGARDAYFTINAHTGELIQLRALDRDPPRGRDAWRVKVQVKDGQKTSSSFHPPSSSSSSYPSSGRRYPRVSSSHYPNLPEFKELTPPLMKDLEVGPVPDEKEFVHDTDWYIHQTETRNGNVANLHKGTKKDVARQHFRHEERMQREKEILQRNTQNDGVKLTPKRALSKRFANVMLGKELHTDIGNTTKIIRSNKVLEDGYQRNPSELHEERFRSSEIIRDWNAAKKSKPHIQTDTDDLHERLISGTFDIKEQEQLKSEEEGIMASQKLNNSLDSFSSSSSLPGRVERETEVKFLDPIAHSLFEDVNQKSSKLQMTVVKRHSSELGRCQDYSGDSSDISGNGNHQSSRSGYFTRYGDIGGINSGSGVNSGNEDPVSRYRRPNIHMAETVVTVVVKDINDNAPTFPNATIFGEVQENGPIDLSVAVVSAWDADDEEEGTNALITYSLESNVIEEKSGQAIFSVHPETGLVRTVICCLDRETTPEYHIQVVAADGGGLKGTGTVVVRLADVNDNSPRLTQDLWQVVVNETWASRPPDNATLVRLSTLDHDTSNYFFYRVVESSGWGWEHFAVRTHGTIGELYANRTLDYEDPTQRRGFRFMVQVTDRGRGGWSDSRHTDTAWVSVQLRDLNDNPPEFRRPHVHITVREDTPPGTLLATLPARDPDMNGHQKVKYRVWASWGALTVDEGGGVRLWRSLDREWPGGEKVMAKVVGVDEGNPPLSATATLTITVMDVNDCPPRLLPPTILHIREGVAASRLGMLTATDDDVWALGHGPPFNFSLAPTNPQHILRLLALKYDPTVDSSRGGAEVWTLGPIDREEYPQLTAEILLSDAGGLSGSQPVTVIVDDINDNPMKPASKTIYLWKMQGGGVDADIGRVYVDDPDDWDLEDKSFSWAGSPHPLFTLDARTGVIYASTLVREGRYELHFHVSDRVWRQANVSANVTVAVRHLSPESLAHAVPVTLTPVTPSQITAGWTPSQGGGGLGLLTAAVKTVVDEDPQSVEIVSVYGLSSSSASVSASIYPDISPHHHHHRQSHRSPSSDLLKAPFACVWISVRKKGGSYIDPIKLQGLLALHIQRIEDMMKLRVLLEDPSREMDSRNNGKKGLMQGSAGESGPSSVSSMASTSLSLQVVDTNSTSLVTPKLSKAIACNDDIRDSYETCTKSSCLNGGRCIRTDKGKRCVCPGGTWGKRCKILSRTFQGGGWAWVRPLSPCLPTTISLRLLTTKPEGTLLYSGPLASTSPSPRQLPPAMLAMQVVNGKPQVLLEGIRGPVKLEVDTPVNTGDWHTLHLYLSSQGAALMVDSCGNGWKSNSSFDEPSHCIARAAWVEPHASDGWISSVPLQVGGLAHPYPHPHLFGWSSAPVPRGLIGCVSHLKINNQLIDLGEPAFSSGSSARCRSQDISCEGGCGFRGHCVNGLNKPLCHCDPGWSGPKCSDPTIPVTLGHGSFITLNLNFTPDPHTFLTQMRVRTQGRSHGLLMQIIGRGGMKLQVKLRGGIACAVVTGLPEKRLQEVCLEDYFLGDGSWHDIYVTRRGYDLSVDVDDGEGWRHNETLTSVLRDATTDGIFQESLEPTVPFFVDNNNNNNNSNSLAVGGIPESDLELSAVALDLTHSCIDDLRISGKPLPLPSNSNETGNEWGHVGALQRVDQGCVSPDLCLNTSCLPPLSCHQTWRHTTCSCGAGSQLQAGICQDIDECSYGPCLHGGTCTNLSPGYECSCSQGASGYNCEWHELPAHSHQLTPPVAIAALTLSLLVLVLMGVLLTIWIHRSRAARGGGIRQSVGEGETDVGSVMGVIETGPLSTQDARSLASKEEKTLLESLLKMRLPGKSTAPEEMKKTAISSISSPRLPDVPLKDTNLASSSPSLLSVSKRSPSSESVLGSTRGLKLSASASMTSLSSGKAPKVIKVISGVSASHSLQPQDDLRAYAYEGEGSPTGSLTSTVLGLRRESMEDSTIKSLVPEFKDVFNLLKTLPDAVGPRMALPNQMPCHVANRTYVPSCSRGALSMPPSTAEDTPGIISRGSSQCPDSSCSGCGDISRVGTTASFGTLPHNVHQHVPPSAEDTCRVTPRGSFKCPNASINGCGDVSKVGTTASFGTLPHNVPQNVPNTSRHNTIDRKSSPGDFSSTC